MDKPMLGGCCVCLDERGWTENPLVYCDGQGCSIAVHQACYGIVDVPSGPWFCRKCELKEAEEKLKCELCPHQDGALKKSDSGGWAHVVCALYIPEVQFGNVSTMEPIVLEKIPQTRYDKVCYICEKENSSKKCSGACMDCAKSGCKSSFHVTCAQMSGLLCEEAGSSNTTKYCGYCQQHLPKGRKTNPFRSIACSKVYKRRSSEESSPTRSSQIASELLDKSEADTSTATSDPPVPPSGENDVNKMDVAECRIDNSPSIVDSTPTPTLTLASLADAASQAISLEQQAERSDLQNIQQPAAKNKRSNNSKQDNAKKKKQRAKKTGDESPSKKTKTQKTASTLIPADVQEEIYVKSEAGNTFLEDVGYAVAPKHSVVTLSSFGRDSMLPSIPSEIGRTKPTPPNKPSSVDGLTAIESLMTQQKQDLLQFFKDFGDPNASPLLQSLQQTREENSLLEQSIEKMSQRRDQLLALKARLSVPFHNSSMNSAVVANQDLRLVESKPFQPLSSHPSPHTPSARLSTNHPPS